MARRRLRPGRVARWWWRWRRRQWSPVVVVAAAAVAECGQLRQHGVAAAVADWARTAGIELGAESRLRLELPAQPLIVIGYDTEADRQKYFVTESGITVVTRDYSLFESPVAVDFYTSD